MGVKEFMWSQPNRGPSSVIMGCSVHNQCIERLWCDVFQGCTCLVSQPYFSGRVEEKNTSGPTRQGLVSAWYVIM